MTFTPFNMGDSSVNKGFFSCDIGDIHLVTTHLQPHRGPDDLQIQDQELEMIHATLPQDRVVHLSGDFNREYGVPLERPTSTDTYEATRWGAPQEEDAITDGVICYGADLSQVRVVDTFDGNFAPTDHRGVYSTL